MGWAAYVHIPFCARVCPYCDFAVVVGEDGAAERYVAALLTELVCERGWGSRCGRLRGRYPCVSHRGCSDR